MEYAVFKTGGKQYKVSKGDIVDVDELPQKDGEFVFDKVLLLVSNGQITVGSPYIPSATITVKILGQKKGEKIRVSKYKSKVRYRKTIGFRAHLTRLQVESVSALPKRAKSEESLEKSPKKRTTTQEQA